MNELINQLQEFMQIKFDELKFTVKPLMSVDELSKYLDLSPAYIHKMTHNREIPYYKPNGKKLYFNKEEIDQWVFDNRVAPAYEIRRTARKIAKRG